MIKVCINDAGANQTTFAPLPIQNRHNYHAGKINLLRTVLTIYTKYLEKLRRKKHNVRSIDRLRSSLLRLLGRVELRNLSRRLFWRLDAKLG